MILLVNICKERLHFYEFVKPVGDILIKNNIKDFIRRYDCITKRDLEKASKIIICGTSLQDNEFLGNLEKFDWLKDYKKPVLGICGGSHVIGLLLGYKVKKEKEIGLKEINLEKEFLGLSGKLSVYHLHQFRVLPEIFHKDNFYATLFHPEVRNKKMILNFARL